MRRDDLNSDIYTNVNISDEMVDSLVADLNKGRRHADIRFRYSTAIMALIILGVVGFGSIGASAAYISYKNRIQDMSEEEQADYVKELENDIYNTASEVRVRDLTDSEYARYLELEDAYYNNGVFPENILKHVERLDEIDPDELAFVEELNKINMPEGELTDEQLLQLIDHEAKYIHTIEQNAQEQLAAEEEAAVEGAVAEGDEELSEEWPEDWGTPFMDDIFFDVTPEDEAAVKAQAFAFVKEFYGDEINDSWNCSVTGNDFSSWYGGDQGWIGYDVELSESDAPNATFYQITIPKYKDGILMLNCGGKKYYADRTEYTRKEAEAFVEEGKKAALDLVNEKFGLGTPDRIEIGGFMNAMDEEITSSDIFFELYYGDEYVAVDWNINTKKFYSISGRGLLNMMR
ncbi:MAG: hypothetical protein IKR23_04450 [Lachnospiraceae bacterium]|nr:hypothetical protein [Lachnospiraceae bacterium]